MTGVKTVPDYPIIRPISPFTLLQRPDRAIIAFQFVPDLAAMKKSGERKREKASFICIYVICAHSHPGSDRNDLNAREAPEECRCARIYHKPRGLS